MSKANVERGKRFERELVDWFNTNTPLTCHRSVATQHFTNNRLGQPDLLGLPHLAVEAKRTERLNIEEAMAQSIRNASTHEMPIVIHRRDRQPLPQARVTISLQDFTSLYNAYLRAQGFTT